MRNRALWAWVLFCCALLLSACGGGSGRRGVDIVVTGSGPTSQVAGGDTVVFTMTVRNAGPGDASDVKVNDIVGNQLALTSITCTAAGGASCPETMGTTMTVPSMPAGSSLSFDVTVQASSTAHGTIGNSMSAQVAEDLDLSNNQATASATAYTASATLAVSASGPTGSVAAGGTAAFLMTVTNNGPDAATNVTIQNETGNGLTLSGAGITCVAAGGATCPSTGPLMSVPTLPAGGSLAFTVNTNVTASSPTATLTDKMTASADNSTSRSNAATATVTVVNPTSGVFATGTGPTGTVAGGGTAVFTMQVGNSGPDPATNVSILDNVGSGLSFVGLTCTASGGATCPTTLQPSMSVASMPANSALTFTVTTTVGQNINGTVINTLSVTADNDSNRSDNSATAVATVSTPRSTLTSSGSPPAGQVAGGATASFVMTVGNTGPNDATAVRIVNTVGSNLTFTGASCAASGGATCPASVGVVTNVDTLPVGGLLTLTINATVAPGTNGAITDTLQATASNDGTSGGTSVVAVGQAFTATSNLGVSGSGPSNVPGGTATSFLMTVTNSGPDAASAVHLVNTVGGNLTLTGVSCSASGGATCPPTLGAVMDASNLPAGGALTFTVNANVAAGTQGTITNTMTASVSTGNRTSVSGVAVGSAYSNNLSVSGSAPAGPVYAGQSATFAMTVANTGPGPAQNVALTSTLSSGLAADNSVGIGCVASGGAVCPAAPSSSMTVTAIPANGALTFTVPAIVNAGFNGSVSDTLAASAAGDARANDNSATASTTGASVDVGVVASGPATVSIGTNAVFTAVISNPGPSTVYNLGYTSSVTGAGAAGGTPTVTCTASAGATCPNPGGTTSLAANRTLTLTITIPALAYGPITSTTTISADGDAAGAGNNTSSATAQAVDPRSGSYRVFAADGTETTMSVDFDRGTYAMSGGGTVTFGAAGNGDYATSNPAVNFRVATDLIVGAHDFGNGVVPYVAGRSLGTSIADAQSQYNLGTRDLPVSGSPVTRPGSAAVTSDGTLFVCQADNGTLKPVASCAGSLASYGVSVGSDGLYTATPISGATSTLTFHVLRSGNSKVFVSAGDATDSLNNPIKRFRLGLPDSPALAGGALRGGSTVGEWVAVTLGSNSYASTGPISGALTASLSPISGSGASSLLKGTRSDGPAIYVMQSGPLAAAFGAYGGTASGQMQLVTP